MIEQAPAYSSMGLNEMFNVSAEEAAAGGGFAAASGGSILAGSLGGVASTGVIPLLGGVTAAYWGGIALGTLIAHGIGLYGRSIFEGVPMTSAEYINTLPAGQGVGMYGNNNYVVSSDWNHVLFFSVGNYGYMVFINNTSNTDNMYITTYNSQTGAKNRFYGSSGAYSSDKYSGQVYLDGVPFGGSFASIREWFCVIT